MASEQYIKCKQKRSRRYLKHRKFDAKSNSPLHTYCCTFVDLWLGLWLIKIFGEKVYHFKTEHKQTDMVSLKLVRFEMTYTKGLCQGWLISRENPCFPLYHAVKFLINFFGVVENAFWCPTFSTTASRKRRIWRHIPYITLLVYFELWFRIKMPRNGSWVPFKIFASEAAKFAHTGW